MAIRIFIVTFVLLQWLEMYTSEFSLVGCFEDYREHRILPDYSYDSKVMTTAACIDYCKSKDRSYAGTQYSIQCFCGDGSNVVWSLLRPNRDCNLPCIGNASEMCGGLLRLNIYTEVECTGSDIRIICYSRLPVSATELQMSSSIDISITTTYRGFDNDGFATSPTTEQEFSSDSGSILTSASTDRGHSSSSIERRSFTYIGHPFSTIVERESSSFGVTLLTSASSDHGHSSSLIGLQSSTNLNNPFSTAVQIESTDTIRSTASASSPIAPRSFTYIGHPFSTAVQQGTSSYGVNMITSASSDHGQSSSPIEQRSSTYIGHPFSTSSSYGVTLLTSASTNHGHSSSPIELQSSTNLDHPYPTAAQIVSTDLIQSTASTEQHVSTYYSHSTATSSQQVSTSSLSYPLSRTQSSGRGNSISQTTAMQTSNNGMPTTSTSTLQDLCKCNCNFLSYNELFNTSALENRIKDMKEKLKVKKSSISRFVRAKESAKDDRKSSVGLGVLGVTLLSVVFGSVILSDLINLIAYVSYCLNRRYREKYHETVQLLISNQANLR